MLCLKTSKKIYKKNIKPKNYASYYKIWLKSKYIKTKQNQKPKAKFFKIFQIVGLVEKQVYKFKLLKKRKIHNVFYMSLLEENPTRKEQMNKSDVIELGANDIESKKYKVEKICDNVVYTKELVSYLS